MQHSAFLLGLYMISVGLGFRATHAAACALSNGLTLHLYSARSAQLLFMLMCTAEFEYKLKEILKKLLADRTERWDTNKKETAEQMMELSDYFTGDCSPENSGCARTAAAQITFSESCMSIRGQAADARDQE